MMQYTIHKGDEGPVLVQYSLSNGQQLDVWTSAAAISEAGYILNEIFNQGEYLKHGITLRPAFASAARRRRLVPPALPAPAARAGDTVVDVGANIGLFGARALSRVPAGDLAYLGVEPCPATFSVLRRNLLGPGGAGRQNSMFHINEQLVPGLLGGAGQQEQEQEQDEQQQQQEPEKEQQQQQQQQRAGACSEAVGAGSDSGSRKAPPYPANIRLVQAALSSAPGRAAMAFFPHMPGNSTLRPAEKQRLQGRFTPQKYLQGQQEVEVPLLTLAQLLEQEDVRGPVALLKIDVEGEELEVLRGLDAAGWRRVQQVALEVHDCVDAGDDDAAGAAGGSADAAQPAGQPPGAAAAAASEGAAPSPARLGAARAPPPPLLDLSTPAGFACAFEQLVAQELPGPRTGRDIDGRRIRYVALPLRAEAGAAAVVAAGFRDADGAHTAAAASPPAPPTTPPPAAAGAAGAASAMAHQQQQQQQQRQAAVQGPPLVPPPQDDGRTMAVARMLRDLGFRVVIECSFGLPANYSVYAVRDVCAAV